MSEKSSWWSIVLSCLVALVCIAGFVFLAFHLNVREKDVCVYQSSEIVGHRVTYVNGLFSKSGPMFQVSYNGHRRVSGKACIAKVYVSEKQYDAVVGTEVSR